MSYTRELKERFIQLRARGVSFTQCSEQLKVSRRTLLYWAEEFRDDISSAHREMLRELQAKYHLTHLDNVEEIGTQIVKVREAINARDFGKESLRDLYAAQKLLEDRLSTICTL